MKKPVGGTITIRMRATCMSCRERNCIIGILGKTADDNTKDVSQFVFVTLNPNMIGVESLSTSKG